MKKKILPNGNHRIFKGEKWREACIENMCETTPSFNYSGLIMPIYCGSHCKNGMVNILKESQKKNEKKYNQFHQRLDWSNIQKPTNNTSLKKSKVLDLLEQKFKENLVSEEILVRTDNCSENIERSEFIDFYISFKNKSVLCYIKIAEITRESEYISFSLVKTTMLEKYGNKNIFVIAVAFRTMSNDSIEILSLYYNLNKYEINGGCNIKIESIGTQYEKNFHRVFDINLEIKKLFSSFKFEINNFENLLYNTKIPFHRKLDWSNVKEPEKSIAGKNIQNEKESKIMDILEQKLFLFENEVIVRKDSHTWDFYILNTIDNSKRLCQLKVAEITKDSKSITFNSGNNGTSDSMYEKYGSNGIFVLGVCYRTLIDDTIEILSMYYDLSDHIAKYNYHVSVDAYETEKEDKFHIVYNLEEELKKLRIFMGPTNDKTDNYKNMISVCSKKEQYGKQLLCQKINFINCNRDGSVYDGILNGKKMQVKHMTRPSLIKGKSYSLSEDGFYTSYRCGQSRSKTMYSKENIDGFILIFCKHENYKSDDLEKVFIGAKISIISIDEMIEKGVDVNSRFSVSRTYGSHKWIFERAIYL